jgi:hypothetical protein
VAGDAAEPGLTDAVVRLDIAPPEKKLITSLSSGPEGAEMPLASSLSSYPLLNLFWTMLFFFMWVIWIWVLITVFIDIFRSHDLGGGAKALWFLFVLFIPLIGVLVYLIARGTGMHERAEQRAERQNEQLQSYLQQSAGTQNTTADQLTKLASLRDSGAITPEEFEQQKAKVLA